VTPRPEGQRRGGRLPPRARGHPQSSTLTLGELQHARYRLSGLLRLVGCSHLSRTLRGPDALISLTRVSEGKSIIGRD
jgi:hypothetical protein